VCMLGHTRCFSHCCALVDTHALARHASTLLVEGQFCLAACTDVTIFARFLAIEMRFSWYVGWLIREYIYVNCVFFCSTLCLDDADTDGDVVRLRHSSRADRAPHPERTVCQ